MRVLAIESEDDPRVADYRNVRDADLRVRDGLFMTEGRLNVKRLITVSPYRTRSVFVTEAGLRGIRPALERLGDETPIYVAAPPLLCAVVGYAMHRGCLAAGERGAEPELAPSLSSRTRRRARCSCSRTSPTPRTSAPYSATRWRSAPTPSC